MAKELEFKLKANTAEAISNVDKLNDSLEETKEVTTKAANDFSEFGSQLDNVSGGAVSRFNQLRGSILGLGKGVRNFNGIWKASVFGLIVTTVVALTKAFTSSEEGQNKLARGLKQLSVIAGNVSDIFSSLGKTLIGVFTLNLEEIKSGFDELSERVTNFGSETAREFELAGDIADRIADANKQERELLVERAKTNVEINKLKTKAAEVDKFTSEQRIAFLEQAAALEDEITGKEVALAEQRLQVKKDENSLSESTREDLEEEARLEAELIRLQEGRLIRNKELLGVAAGLRKMEADKAAAELKAQQAKDEAEKQKAEAAETARLDSISKIQQEFIKKSEDAKANTELKKLNLERDRRLAELDALGATEQQKLELIKYFAEQEANIKEGLDQEEANRLEQNQMLKMQGIMDSLDAVRMAAGEETTIGKALFIAKTALMVKEQIMNAKATLGRIIAAAAESGVDGAKGLMKAAASAPPPANVPLIAIFAAQAAGIAMSVKSAVDAAKGQIKGGGGIAAPSTPARRGAPAFNIVGANPTNQIAEAISNQNEKPIKAFVVSNEISNQQALDRNITQTASLG